MAQQYLGATVFDDEVYSTDFSQAITAWMPPACPATFEGVPAYYDVEAKECRVLPRDLFNAQALAQSSGACGAQFGGGPFLKEINGQCYPTNNCPVASALSQSCLNGQQLPVRQSGLSEPGVIANSMYGGPPTNWWTYLA